jgi:cytochrome oxidase Cu insertion factor (SCO1/SenC/PrrC family)
MNKRNLFFAAIAGLMMASACFFSQVATAQIPTFQMKLSNGTTFSSSQVSKQKPLLIIYFAPDCEHCQILMNELFKKITDFKSAQILMVTFQPLTEVAWFEKKYQTAKYSNLKVGTEVPAFFFKNKYQLEHTPFTALFSKNGKLVVSYKEKTPVPDLIKRLKSLK